MALRDLIFIITINMIWGMNFVALVWALDDFTPLLANSLRFAIVAILLSPFLRGYKDKLRQVIQIGLLLGVLHFGLVIIGMSMADGISSIAIVAQLTVPFSTILAVVLLKETVGWKRILGIALSFSGIMVVGFDPSIFAQIPALLVILLATFISALALVNMRQIKDVPAMTVQAWVGLMAVIGSIILSFIFEEGQMANLQAASLAGWSSVLYAGVFATVIGHVGVNYLLRKYEVSVVAPYMLLMPIFGILSGVVMLGEVLTTREIIGGLITLLGVVIITMRNNVKLKVPLLPVEEV